MSRNRSHRQTRPPNDHRRLTPADVERRVSELEAELRAGIDREPQRLDCNAENVEQGLARLVLSLIELLRQLLERQAIRRMQAGSLDDEKVEEIGQALMKLEARVRELSASFGLRPEDLNLGLGPAGNLLPRK